jgi:hypothetical protein
MPANTAYFQGKTPKPEAMKNRVPQTARMIATCLLLFIIVKSSLRFFNGKGTTYLPVRREFTTEWGQGNAGNSERSFFPTEWQASRFKWLAALLLSVKISGHETRMA